MTTKKLSRCKRALTMLQVQLKSGVKTQKGTFDVKIPLDNVDINRINKEINILNNKINKSKTI